MYKCKECEEIFDEPKKSLNICFEGMEKEINVCTACNDSGFEEAYGCEACGEYFVDGELSSGYCDDCIEEAEAGYSTELGKQFILEDEEDFYLRHLNGIPNCRDGGHLLYVLKKNPNPDYEKELKEYCLADITSWAEFYYRGSNEANEQKQAYKEAV